MAERTHPFSSPLFQSKASHLSLLFVLATFILILGLGDMGLTDRDEGSNAEAGREMLETGDWISPTLNYEPRYAKPALVYWLLSGTYAIGGVNEWTARLPSAIFGIGLILIHYVFARRVLGATIALMASLMLLLNIETVAICRAVLTDPELVFFTTVATYSFWLGLKGEKSRDRSFFWLFYAAMGLAMLTKGPVGFIIPFLAIIPYLTLTRQWKLFWEKGYPILGLGIFGVVAIPWYVAMFIIHGADYLAAAQANTTGRFANPMEGHGGTLLFFIPVLFLGFFPWSGLLPSIMYQTLRNWKECRQNKNDAPAHTGERATVLTPGPLSHTPNQFYLRELTLFLTLWVVGIFIFFSLSATRLPHYIFPLYPAASILAASFWVQCAQGSSSKSLRIAMRIIVTVGCLFGVALAALPTIYHKVLHIIVREFPAAYELDPGMSPLVLGTIVIGCVLAIRHFSLNEDHQKTAFGIACGMMLAVILIIIVLILPRFSTYFLDPPQALASIAGMNLGSTDRLIQFGRKRPSLVFYAKRKVYQINPGEDEKFQPHLRQPGHTMIILQSHLQSRLPPPVSEFPVVLTLHGFSLLSNMAMVK